MIKIRFKGIMLLYLIALFPLVVTARVYSEDLVYDPNGNLIQDIDKTYEYNTLQQLKRVNSSQGVLEEYFYDQNGKRIKKITYNVDGSNVTTYYIGEDYVETVDASGTHDTTYYYLAGKLVGSEDESGKQFYHPNHLGSTHIVTNEAGFVVEENEYMPYGELLGESDSRYVYTGKELDRETGLHYYGARYYNSYLMHFTQPDIIVADMHNPQDLNRYAYARNNPSRYKDDSGNIPLDTVADVGFILWDVGVLLIIGAGVQNENWKALGFDVAGAAIPYATGLGKAYKAEKAASRALKVTEQVAEEGAKITKKSTIKEFYEKTARMSPAQRIAEFKTMAKDIALEKGWTKDTTLTRKYGREVYYSAEEKTYYSLDTQHGRFEVLDEAGRHKGEVDFDLNPTKGRDPSGKHDLRGR